MRTAGFLNTSEGTKYLLCDGSQIPSNYPKLRSLMTHTPNLRDRVPQGSGVYAINSKIEAALPNIKGEAKFQNNCGLAEVNGSGPFYRSKTSFSTALLNVTTAGSYALGFDASYSSPIYKDDCTTVQPSALAVNFYIKAK